MSGMVSMPLAGSRYPPVAQNVYVMFVKYYLYYDLGTLV